MGQYYLPSISCLKPSINFFALITGQSLLKIAMVPKYRNLMGLFCCLMVSLSRNLLIMPFTHVVHTHTAGCWPILGDCTPYRPITLLCAGEGLKLGLHTANSYVSQSAFDKACQVSGHSEPCKSEARCPVFVLWSPCSRAAWHAPNQPTCAITGVKYCM